MVNGQWSMVNGHWSKVTIYSPHTPHTPPSPHHPITPSPHLATQKYELLILYYDYVGDVPKYKFLAKFPKLSGLC